MIIRHLTLLCSLLLLAGCLQERAAPIEQYGDRYYGPDGAYDRNTGTELPRYSNNRRATMPAEQDSRYIKDDRHEYGVSATVGDVQSSELPPVDALPDPALSSPVVTRVTEPVIVQAPVVVDVPVAPTAPVVNAPAPQPFAQPGDVNNNRSFLPRGWADDTSQPSQIAPAPATMTAPAVIVDVPANTTIITQAPQQPIASAPLGGSRSPVMPSSQPDPDFVWPLRGSVAQHALDPKGIAIAGRVGEPIRAAADGVVVHVGSRVEGFGTMIIIQHLSGFVSTYAHLSDVVVAENDDIVQGQLIGFVGQSGGALAPQLGFSIRQNTQAVQPQSVLPR